MDSGSKTIEVGHVLKNSTVVLKGNPCKVVEVNQHGDKTQIICLDVFTQIKYQDILANTENIEELTPKRTDYQLVDLMDDGSTEIMSDQGDIRSDLKVPSALLSEGLTKFSNGEPFMVTVLSAMDKEAIIGFKILTS